MAQIKCDLKFKFSYNKRSVKYWAILLTTKINCSNLLWFRWLDDYNHKKGNICIEKKMMSKKFNSVSNCNCPCGIQTLDAWITSPKLYSLGYRVSNMFILLIKRNAAWISRQPFYDDVSIHFKAVHSVFFHIIQCTKPGINQIHPMGFSLLCQVFTEI